MIDNKNLPYVPSSAMDTKEDWEYKASAIRQALSAADGVLGAINSVYDAQLQASNASATARMSASVNATDDNISMQLAAITERTMRERAAKQSVDPIINGLTNGTKATETYAELLKPDNRSKYNAELESPEKYKEVEQIKKAFTDESGKFDDNLYNKWQKQWQRGFVNLNKEGFMLDVMSDNPISNSPYPYLKPLNYATGAFAAYAPKGKDKLDNESKAQSLLRLGKIYDGVTMKRIEGVTAENFMNKAAMPYGVFKIDVHEGEEVLRSLRYQEDSFNSDAVSNIFGVQGRGVDAKDQEWTSFEKGVGYWATNLARAWWNSGLDFLKMIPEQVRLISGAAAEFTGGTDLAQSIRSKTPNSSIPKSAGLAYELNRYAFNPIYGGATATTRMTNLFKSVNPEIEGKDSFMNASASAVGQFGGLIFPLPTLAAKAGSKLYTAAASRLAPGMFTPGALSMTSKLISSAPISESSKFISQAAYNFSVLNGVEAADYGRKHGVAYAESLGIGVMLATRKFEEVGLGAISGNTVLRDALNKTGLLNYKQELSKAVSNVLQEDKVLATILKLKSDDAAFVYGSHLGNRMLEQSLAALSNPANTVSSVIGKGLVEGVQEMSDELIIKGFPTIYNAASRYLLGEKKAKSYGLYDDKEIAMNVEGFSEAFSGGMVPAMVFAPFLGRYRPEHDMSRVTHKNILTNDSMYAEAVKMLDREADDEKSVGYFMPKALDKHGKPVVGAGISANAEVAKYAKVVLETQRVFAKQVQKEIEAATMLALPDYAPADIKLTAAIEVEKDLAEAFKTNVVGESVIGGAQMRKSLAIAADQALTDIIFESAVTSLFAKPTAPDFDARRKELLDNIKTRLATDEFKRDIGLQAAFNLKAPKNYGRPEYELFRRAHTYYNEENLRSIDADIKTATARIDPIIATFKAANPSAKPQDVDAHLLQQFQAGAITETDLRNYLGDGSYTLSTHEIIDLQSDLDNLAASTVGSIVEDIYDYDTVFPGVESATNNALVTRMKSVSDASQTGVAAVQAKVNNLRTIGTTEAVALADKFDAVLADSTITEEARVAAVEAVNKEALMAMLAPVVDPLIASNKAYNAVREKANAAILDSFNVRSETGTYAERLKYASSAIVFSIDATTRLRSGKVDRHPIITELDQAIARDHTSNSPIMAGEAEMLIKSHGELLAFYENVIAKMTNDLSPIVNAYLQESSVDSTMSLISLSPENVKYLDDLIRLAKDRIAVLLNVALENEKLYAYDLIRADTAAIRDVFEVLDRYGVDTADLAAAITNLDTKLATTTTVIDLTDLANKDTAEILELRRDLLNELSLAIQAHQSEFSDANTVAAKVFSHPEYNTVVSEVDGFHVVDPTTDTDLLTKAINDIGLLQAIGTGTYATYLRNIVLDVQSDTTLQYALTYEQVINAARILATLANKTPVRIKLTVKSLEPFDPKVNATPGTKLVDKEVVINANALTIHGYEGAGKSTMLRAVHRQLAATTSKCQFVARTQKAFINLFSIVHGKNPADPSQRPANISQYNVGMISNDSTDGNVVTGSLTIPPTVTDPTNFVGRGGLATTNVDGLIVDEYTLFSDGVNDSLGDVGKVPSANGPTDYNNPFYQTMAVNSQPLILLGDTGQVGYKATTHYNLDGSLRLITARTPTMKSQQRAEYSIFRTNTMAVRAAQNAVMSSTNLEDTLQDVDIYYNSTDVNGKEGVVLVNAAALPQLRGSLPAAQTLTINSLQDAYSAQSSSVDYVIIDLGKLLEGHSIGTPLELLRTRMYLQAVLTSIGRARKAVYIVDNGYSNGANKRHFSFHKSSTPYKVQAKPAILVNLKKDFGLIKFAAPVVTQPTPPNTNAGNTANTTANANTTTNTTANTNTTGTSNTATNATSTVITPDDVYNAAVKNLLKSDIDAGTDTVLKALSQEAAGLDPTEVESIVKVLESTKTLADVLVTFSRKLGKGSFAGLKGKSVFQVYDKALVIDAATTPGATRKVTTITAGSTNPTTRLFTVSSELMGVLRTALSHIPGIEDIVTNYKIDLDNKAVVVDGDDTTDKGRLRRAVIQEINAVLARHFSLSPNLKLVREVIDLHYYGHFDKILERAKEAVASKAAPTPDAIVTPISAEELTKKEAQRLRANAQRRARYARKKATSQPTSTSRKYTIDGYDVTLTKSATDDRTTFEFDGKVAYLATQPDGSTTLEYDGDTTVISLSSTDDEGISREVVSAVRDMTETKLQQEEAERLATLATPIDASSVPSEWLAKVNDTVTEMVEESEAALTPDVGVVFFTDFAAFPHMNNYESIIADLPQGARVAVESAVSNPRLANVNTQSKVTVTRYEESGKTTTLLAFDSNNTLVGMSFSGPQVDELLQEAQQLATMSVQTNNDGDTEESDRLEELARLAAREIQAIRDRHVKSIADFDVNVEYTIDTANTRYRGNAVKVEQTQTRDINALEERYAKSGGFIRISAFNVIDVRRLIRKKKSRPSDISDADLMKANKLYREDEEPPEHTRLNPNPMTVYRMYSFTQEGADLIAQYESSREVSDYNNLLNSHHVGLLSEKAGGLTLLEAIQLEEEGALSGKDLSLVIDFQAVHNKDGIADKLKESVSSLVGSNPLQSAADFVNAYEKQIDNAEQIGSSRANITAMRVIHAAMENILANREEVSRAFRSNAPLNSQQLLSMLFGGVEIYDQFDDTAVQQAFGKYNILSKRRQGSTDVNAWDSIVEAGVLDADAVGDVQGIFGILVKDETTKRLSERARYVSAISEVLALANTLNYTTDGKKVSMKIDMKTVLGVNDGTSQDILGRTFYPTMKFDGDTGMNTLRPLKALPAILASKYTLNSLPTYPQFVLNSSTQNTVGNVTANTTLSEPNVTQDTVIQTEQTAARPTIGRAEVTEWAVIDENSTMAVLTFSARVDKDNLAFPYYVDVYGTRYDAVVNSIDSTGTKVTITYGIDIDDSSSLTAADDVNKICVKL
jgi:hypothetical protein